MVSRDAGSRPLERSRKRSGVKVGGSHGVFPILNVNVYTKADRNAALDSWDNKLANRNQYAGFRLKEL